MGPIKAAYRILALIGKEIVEVLRRPGAVISLVLGPFLILAVFGLGYHGIQRDLTTVVVAGADSGLPTDPAGYDNLGARGITVTAVTADRVAAERQLMDGAVDLVIIAPANPAEALAQGHQAELTVEMNMLDPAEANYAGFIAETVAADVNREIYRRGATEGQGYSLRLAGRDLTRIPPEVIASPTVAQVVNRAPVEPSIVAFFGLGALALVIQHMAVTLLGLSIVRERTSGAIELFRVAPMRSAELVLGKVLAQGLLGGTIAVASLALLVGVLGVPMLGPPLLIALTIVLLLLASLGLGLVISLISDSERQAVQLSLLVLLASMFFSGFILRIEEFDAPVQVAAYLLPVTHGIRLLQDLFLRGTIGEAWQLVALALMASVLLGLSWLLVRRELRPA